MPWNALNADFNKFPWSVPLGSVLRIPIRLHVTFFILLLAQTLGSLYYGIWGVFLSLILIGPVLLLTILIHELGHCLAARSIGGTVDSIMLWPLGGLAFMTYNTTYKKAIWVAVAGPLTHIPMVTIWLLLLLPAYHASTGSWAITLELPPLDQRHFGHAICVYGVILNIALFLFNLLVPAYPLDGGRILTMLLMMAGSSMRTAAIVTIGVATPIGLGLFVFGIVVFQMVTILVAVFILFATFQLFQALRADKLAEHPLFSSVSAETPAPPAAGGAAPPGAGGGGAAAASYPMSSKSGTAVIGPPSLPASRGGGVAGSYQPPPPPSSSPYYVGNAV